jgi:hypothetical protein
MNGSDFSDPQFTPSKVKSIEKCFDTKIFSRSHANAKILSLLERASQWNAWTVDKKATEGIAYGPSGRILWDGGGVWA